MNVLDDSIRSKKIKSFFFFETRRVFTTFRPRSNTCRQIWMDRFKCDTLYTPVVIKRLPLGTRRRQFIPETRRARAISMN